MATSTKIITKTQIIRRTLRSNSKNTTHQSFEPVDCQKQEKIINQIKIEIDHQQANNATKISALIGDQVKIQNQIILRKQSLAQSNDNKRSNQSQCFTSDQNISSIRPAQLSLENNENSIESKIEAQSESKKKQHQNLTQKKLPVSKRQNLHSSPYFEQRKSYRNVKKNVSITVPYRLFQDSLQQKIVGLINRICQNKHTEKQIQNFIEKLQKVFKKDINNPYIVSGIRTVFNLCEKRQLINENSLIKFRNQMVKIQKKILEQLSGTNEYENIFHEQKKIDLTEIRPKLVKKVFYLLLKQNQLSISEAKQKSYQTCETLFKKIKSQTTYEQLIQFLKQQKFLSF